MHFAPSGHVEGICSLLGDVEGNVLEKFLFQPVAEVPGGDELALLAREGESLTAKVISMVGSEIFTKGSGSTHSGAHRVRPMVMSAIPDSATISPA